LSGRNRSIRFSIASFIGLCGGFCYPSLTTVAAGAVAPPPTTIHILRARASYDHTASKFTYYTVYFCFFTKYWGEASEPEPLRTEHSKQRALASTPPADTYLAADQGEVDEYFAPGRYARYERSVTFEAPSGGGCSLQMIRHTKVQIAQGNRLVNAQTDNGKTRVSEVPLRPIPMLSDREIKLAEQAAAAASPLFNGSQPGDYSKAGHKKIAGEDCEIIVNTAPIVAMTISQCVWEGIKSYPTPLGPKAIVLSLEGSLPPGAPSNIVSDPIVVDTMQVLHWTETASEFHVNESFSDQIFTPPPRSK
jgi:hypothetical protein